MSRTLILACAFALVGQRLPAQNTTLSGRTNWTDQAPRVRVAIDGPRAVSPGMPMRVRFEVSDDAFVTVVRVDENGRMSILFPYARNQRAAARAGMVNHVRNPRLGDASFIATDRMGGYVFALASYAPLDFSSFENRDYDRVGGWSAFTQVNRTNASRPDVFIDRFAATVLWDRDTPYDYDVDYYTSAGGVVGAQTSYAMCGSLFGRLRLQRRDVRDDTRLGVERLGPGRLPVWLHVPQLVLQPPVLLVSLAVFVLGVQADHGGRRPEPERSRCRSTRRESSHLTRAWCEAAWLPQRPCRSCRVTPTRRRSSDPCDSAGPRFAEGNDWEKIMSIPARATRRMKQEDDVRRERGSMEGASPGADRARPARGHGQARESAHRGRKHPVAATAA